MQIRICLTEAEIARGFLQALKRGRLPEKFFYWSPLSVEAWLRLCRSGRYRHHDRSLAVAEKVSTRLARGIRASRIQWISLGSGQGAKELPFLKSLLKAKKAVCYFPIDFSQPLLELAVDRADRLGIATLGIKADIEDRSYWNAIPRAGKDETRIVSLLGNTLGNFDSRAILRILGRSLRTGDRLVVDGELFSSERRIRSGYDHPVNRRFALAPLRSVGISETDGALRFDFKNAGDGIYRLSKRFRFNRDRKVTHAGRNLTFRRGKVLRMSDSYKYDPRGMEQLLETGGLFRMEHFFRSPDGRFGLWTARRK